MNSVILGLLLALASPLLLLPVEKILPYPYFIEEGVKLIIVLMIMKKVKRGAMWAFLAGFLFAFSESVFYLVNIFALGNLMIFPQRLLLTGGLHTGTVMLMYFFGRKSYLGLAVGFGVAVTVHYLFNLWVVNF